MPAYDAIADWYESEFLSPEGDPFGIERSAIRKDPETAREALREFAGP
jgi:hypothetical protein